MEDNITRNSIWLKLVGRDLTRYLIYERDRIRIWVPIVPETSKQELELTIEIYEEGLGFVPVATRTIKPYTIRDRDIAITLV